METKKCLRCDNRVPSGRVVCLCDLCLYYSSQAEAKDLKDKLHRRNMQIKDLTAKKDNMLVCPKCNGLVEYDDLWEKDIHHSGHCLDCGLKLHLLTDAYFTYFTDHIQAAFGSMPQKDGNWIKPKNILSRLQTGLKLAKFRKENNR